MPTIARPLGSIPDPRTVSECDALFVELADIRRDVRTKLSVRDDVPNRGELVAADALIDYLLGRRGDLERT